jgi:hypothetical protein
VSLNFSLFSNLVVPIMLWLTPSPFSRSHRWELPRKVRIRPVHPATRRSRRPELPRAHLGFPLPSRYRRSFASPTRFSPPSPTRRSLTPSSFLSIAQKSKHRLLQAFLLPLSLPFADPSWSPSKRAMWWVRRKSWKPIFILSVLLGLVRSGILSQDVVLHKALAYIQGLARFFSS